MTLSHIISSITTQFLPALHYKYVFKNFKQSDLYRSYNPSVVPDYLQGRPKETILHCLHRQGASNKFVREDIVHVHMENFEVKGKKGSYTVNFGDQSHDPHCTCRDWLTFHLPCKHFFAIFHHFPDWNWEKLPKHYLMPPYLSADSEAIAEYISGTQKSSAEHSINLEDTLQDHPESNYSEIPRKVRYNSFMLSDCFEDGGKVS